ncbi:MAG: rsmI-A [Chlamydiales bacterium]|jgi:16S rRNA (cytidine1402-2'-O)-methyltransferase|nr:rsmI-A [Chlamydiales bacterium]
MPLFLVPTPIGNLEDFSKRAISILSTCDYILCEDTRHSHILLSHYDIRKPLKSFHQRNEIAKGEFVLSDLQQGMHIALLSDAGTPLIQDPGYPLIQRCLQEGIAIDALPGPCALITALSLSGLQTDRFQFIGFLPRKEMALKATLEEMSVYTGTSIAYESIHRLQETLESLKTINPLLPTVVARELTKKFQDIYRGTAEGAALYYETAPLKGEIVLLVQGSAPTSDQPPHLLVQQAEERLGLSRMDAIKHVAKEQRIPKKVVYQAVLQHLESPS